MNFPTSSRRRRSAPQRNLAWVGLITILTLILSFFPQVVPGAPVPMASAHNLQTKFVYMFFDPNTQAKLDIRIAGGDPLYTPWNPPMPLLKAGDELGIILKVVPRDGTTTGVGGHVDFYVPDGTTVLDAAYLMPGDADPSDGISGYDKVAMKGQSLIAIGDGPIGAKATSQLIGLGPVGPNINGVTENPVVPGTGLHRGTISGVYGDTGIFYATDPDTSFGSWQRFTGDADQICGLAGLPGVTGKTLTNNSGDVVVPCNKWDAGQLYAWGVKGTSWTGSGASSTPIVDYGDGRGNAPWGFASGVAGPQSGYAWNFDWNEWRTSTKTAADMRNAMGNDEIGPWKRIQYPGSRISKDQPGLTSTVLGIASIDGGSIGYPLSPSNPLPATTSQLAPDTTSPKAIRWAVGQLTSLVPEFVWVKIKVDDPADLVNTDGCPVFHGDTFGGDAGGSDNGKDHLWRYYEPSLSVWNGCLALGKPATKDVVKVGDTYQYNVKVYNAGAINDFTNVVIKDTLPSGVQFVSAVPAPSSGPNPLVWNVASLKRGEMFEATVTVKATGTGALENTLCVDAAGTDFDQCATDITTSGPVPMLKQAKTASPTTVTPGGSVQYTVRIDNIGSGPTGSPITVLDYLPTGFTFASKDLVTLNGADVTAATSATSASGQVLFTVTGPLNAGQSLILKYTVNVPLGTPAGVYCNSYTTTQNGIPLTTGSLACVTVGDAAIGDTLFRDWNGNGVQDPEDEGIAGVTLELRGSGGVIATKTTDENGKYLFDGRSAGDYTVVITDLGEDGLPGTLDEMLRGYTQTYDPDGACPGGSCDKQSAVTLDTGERDLNQDFGFKPGGTGSIGDTVWKDDGAAGSGVAGNGVQDGTESGIANVTVYLYEDTNGNGAIDADDALVATDETDATGIYGFPLLALNLNYLVKIDEADPEFLAAFGAGPIAASTFRLQAAQPTTDEPAIDTVDFGYYQPPPAAVGDTVCQDVDGDRLCTGADTPLANIEVQLYRDLNRNGLVDQGEPLLATQSTDASGYYHFTDLAPGAYVVQVNTTDPDLPGGLATVRNPQGVILNSGDDNPDIDFPFVSRLTKAVRNVTTNQDPGDDADPGDTLEFKVTPNYTGSSLLTNVRVTDTIPTGTTFVSAAPAQTSGPDPLAWNLGSNTQGEPGVGVLCPAELDVPVDADTWIDQDTGGSANLKIYGGDTTLTTRDDTDVSGQDNFALMRFPIGISTLPAGATVEKATLNAYVQGGDGAGRALNVYELKTAWVEGTADGTTCNGSQDGANWAEPDCDASGFWASGSAATGFSSADYNTPALGSLPATDNVKQQMTSAALTQLVKDWAAGTNSNEGLAFFPNVTEQDITLHAKEGSAAPSTTNDAYITIKYLVPQTGACTIKTDGMAAYSINTTASQSRPFVGSSNTWNPVVAMNSFGGANSFKQRFLSLASGTTRNESIAVAVLDGNTVAGQVWNSTAWSFIPNPPAGASGQLGTVSADTFYSADAAYERGSGNAVVVWDDDAQTGSAKLRYATYDGTTWSSAASVGAAYAGGEPLYMQLASQSGADGMVLVVNDLTYDDYALVWDGAAWSNGLSLDTSGTAVDDRTPLYAAYETASGDAMVVYAKHSATPDPKVYYRIWNGTSWSAETALTAPSGVTSQPQWLVLASDPNSDRLALGVLTTARAVWLSVWDGSAWGAKTTATTGAQTKDSPVISVAFESLTGRGLAVYGEGKNVRYRIWSPVSNAWTAETNGPVLANNTATLLLDADPNSNEIMLTSLDSGKDVVANLWSGSAWGTPRTLTGNTNYAVGQPFDFHWQQNALTQPSTKAALTTNRTFVTDTGGGVPVEVVLTVESSQAGKVTATALTVNSTGGAGATCGAASPSGAQDITANGQVQFTYNCTVTASAAPGSVTFTTTPTASDGAGAFLEAKSNSVLATPPLTFRVTVDDPATVSEVDNVATIGDESGNLPPTDSNITVTEIPGGSIGDYVWWDEDTNGLQDEIPATPISGTVVLLYRDVNSNGILDPLNGDIQVGIDFTDITGQYLFEDLPPGKYLVDVYEDSIAAQSIPYIRNIVPTTADVQVVDLGQAEDYRDADFGYFVGARVEGNVFWDEDHNGVLDAGEQDSPHLLNNIMVHIVCYGPDGVPGGTDDRTLDQDTGTPPQPNGHFAFTVPPGPCTLTYETTQTTAAGYPQATTPISYAFMAEAGEDWHPSFDFGVDNAGVIGNLVWYDADGDGVGPYGNGATPGTDNGEPGLAGVTVLVYDQAGTTLLASTVTTAAGGYLFPGLADGTYQVKVVPTTLPGGMTQTYDPDGGADDMSTVTIGGTQPQSNLAQDFGYRDAGLTGTQAPTITGTVWNDLASLGVKDGGEPGLPGVSVRVVYTPIGGSAVTVTLPVDANGMYTVTVPTGSNVAISVIPTTVPPGYSPTTASLLTLTNVTTDQTNQNFGYHLPPASIRGTVCEGGVNGVCGDEGEPGLASAVVTLTWAGPDGILGAGGDDVTFPPQTTPANGTYSFMNLQPGLYQVVETNPAGYSSLADRDGNNPDNITVLNLATGQDLSGQDFVDLQAAGVSGYVFEDLNLDGDRDPGEPPIANVPVTLRNNAGDAIATVNTDALGYYEFTNLPPGSYRITEANLATWISTGDADGAANTTDRIDVTLASGENKTQQNFGDVRPGSIAGIVFNDANNNGVQDSGEGPLANVTVCASPDGGTTTYCDQTDGTGAYLIPNVPPDDYVVTETNPSGYVSTTPDNLPVSVGSGEAVTDVDYGDKLPAANTYTVSGTVCENTVDNDGVCDPGETPLPGVTVKLYNSAGAPIATTTTDAFGNYTFVDVPNGSYNVVETDPIHYTSVNDADGGTDNTVAVTVAGANEVDKDFVDTPQQGGLSGTVYEDLNLNGQRDAGEPGIPGVTVTLTRPDSSTVTAPTDANGDYAFPNLAPGTYILTETDLAGYLSTGDVDGANDNKIVATVPAGVTVTGRDFGDVKLGAIGGTVWNDTNLNGIQDSGEAGIPNVLVCAAPVAGGAQICDTTDANGVYLLPNVPPGAYTVTETDPAGYVSTTPNSVPATVPSGDTATVDYGDVLPNPALGSISGTVCENVNGDGVCDPNEAPLAGVTVELWDVTTATRLRTTTTDANGDYAFPNLPAGSYRVEEVNLLHYTSVDDADGLGNTADAILPIPINGNAVTDRDFVDTPTPGSLSGKVCDDLNRDGVCGTGEPGIDGVTVKLYDSGGALVGTQTTAGGGLYAFPSLPPDTYTVVETDKPSYQSTGDVYGANDNLIMATVPAGTPVTGQNFADALEPGAITGVVYSDLNADGNYDPGEPGLPNVQVCLTPPSGPQVCTTTNAGGQYVFTDLPPGNYTVTEPADPAGYVSTGDADGAIGGFNTIAVTVPAGVTVTERDFFDHEKAVIGVAKRVVGTPVNNGNGTYDVTYEILVKNMGLVVLNSVQVTDSLSATFAGATGFSVLSLATSANLHKNATYTGVPPAPAINLLTGADSLAPSASGLITLTVRVTPGSNLGPYDNRAWATGTSPTGAKPTDLSQDGTNPDPGSPPDGDPTNNNDPTPVTFAEKPVIGVAKRVADVQDNNDGTQTVTYVLYLENLGDVALINVQVMDDLAAAFTDEGAISFSVESVETSANLHKNPGYTGVAPHRGLLMGTDTLAVNGFGTITLKVKVKPGDKLGPYYNQATARADSQSGGITQDQSQDGPDPDPVVPPQTQPDGDPTNNNDRTPVTFTARTQIGAAKDRGTVVNKGDGTYDVTYDIVVENLGATTLTNVQVSDNLATTFTGATGFFVVSVDTSTNLHKNSGYTGSSPDTDLLLGTDTLAPGGTGTITLVVNVTPGSKLGTYYNQARATGTGPGNVPTADNSDYGTEPDPNGNFNPNENGENDRTPVTFTEAPSIGVAKTVGTPFNNGDGTFDVTYTIDVKNLGDVVLKDVQVTDDLGTTFSGATIVGIPSVTSANFAVNMSYDGSTDTALLADGNTLVVGATKSITLKVTVRPATNPATFYNQATATGVSPAGVTVDDLSDKDLPIDPDNDKNADEPGENDRTPVDLIQHPLLGVAKELKSATSNGDGSFTIVYDIHVQNYGDVDIKNLQVTDDLADTFGAPATFSGVTVANTIGTDWAINANYDGSSDTDLLQGTDTLVVDDTGTIRLTVVVTPNEARKKYKNQATVGGDSPLDEPVSDLSQDGANPDGTDGDRNPGNNSDPTWVELTEQPVLGVAKRVVGSPVNNGNGTFTVVYSVLARNYGNVQIEDLQVTDNLDATFGAGKYAVNNVESTAFAENWPDGYTGILPNVALLQGSDTLAVGASGLITLTVTVTPGSNPGPYDNWAFGSGNSPIGTPVDEDQSQDGTEPDDDGDGDPRNDSDETQVSFNESPKLGLAKAVKSYAYHGDGTFTVAYTLTVRNYGDVEIRNLRLRDNLKATFPAPPATLSGILVANAPGSSFALNANYDGSSDIELLQGTDTLPVNGSGAVIVTVTVAPGVVAADYRNAASAVGTSPAGSTVRDVSQNGTDPDPDDDKDPGDNSEETPVSYAEHPKIGVAKRVDGTPVYNGDGTYDVTYEILVQNLGDIVLHDLQVTDNLAATFGAPATFAVVSVESAKFVENEAGTYTGHPPTGINLLAAGNTLVALDQGAITLVVRVNPGGFAGPYDNSATGSGTSPGQGTVSDVSTDGDDTDTDTGGKAPVDNLDASDDLVPTPVSFATGSIGNLVWWDIDDDGRQDDGEPGIFDVEVNLLNAAGVLLGSTTTDSSGNYVFASRPGGTYTVQIVPAEFAADGTLENWTAAKQNELPDDTGDSDGTPVNHDAPATVTPGQQNTTVDFGFTIEFALKVTKRLNGGESVRRGDVISFTIRITNTGQAPITVLPLRDTYDMDYLMYDPTSPATPAPDSVTPGTPGTLDWTDLTASFGRDLGADEHFEVIVYFTTIADTTGLTNGVTVNTAAVHDAYADPDGSGGLPAVALLNDSASDSVAVLAPTGIGVSSFGGVRQGSEVLLAWETAEEANTAGFNVLRQVEGGAFVPINDELLFAQNVGANQGASYSFVDAAAPEGVVVYALELMRLDGSVESLAPIAVQP